MVQNGDIFWVAKISNFLLGCLKFLIYFGVKGRCWARAYVCIKIESSPPPWGFAISSDGYFYEHFIMHEAATDVLSR